jgi:hypothetical protein
VADDPQGLMDRIKRVGKIRELYEVRTFKGYRDRPDGETKSVTVEVWDTGANASARRWHIHATDEDDRVATGSPDASLDVAISTTRWEKLDSD